MDFKNKKKERKKKIHCIQHAWSENILSIFYLRRLGPNFPQKPSWTKIHYVQFQYSRKLLTIDYCLMSIGTSEKF